MDIYAAYIICVILVGLSVFQLLLIAGKPLGRFAWGGKHEVLPRNLRIASGFSILTYIFIGIIVLGAVGHVPIFDVTFSLALVKIFAVYFAFGVLLNAISRSIGERVVMTPVAAVLSVCMFVIA